MLNFQIDDFEKRTSGDHLILEALRIIAKTSEDSRGRIGPSIKAAWRIRDSMPLAESVDNFLDAHNGDKLIERCGKLAIVRSILDAEKRSKLYFEYRGSNSSIDYKSVQDTWFNKFYKVLTENCRKEDLASRLDSLAMVIFNYDRCFEHFLVNAIQTYYGVDEKEAAGLLNRIEIYHPYGKVGHLPWQQCEESIAFGAEPSSSSLLKLSEQIRTFTEGTDPSSSKISSIKKRTQHSELIVFLGFAFHEINLELLKPYSDIRTTKSGAKCFATAKGISDHDCINIKEELSKLLKQLKSIYIRNDLSCDELFREYRRSLSYT